MNFFDLTHRLEHHLPAFPGDELPELEAISTVEKNGHAKYRLTTGMHVGTHMDAPAHMLSGGKLISEFSVERFVVRAHIIDARGQASVPRRLFIGHDIKPGDAVLVCTGWGSKFGQNGYFEYFPDLDMEFVQECIAAGVSFVGLDTPSPDHEPYALHKMLFEKDILIIENLTGLESLVEYGNCMVAALPLKLSADSAPCRVVAWKD